MIQFKICVFFFGIGLPDTSLNLSGLSLPALYSQLQQSTSTTLSTQKPIVTHPVDPYQNNYIRMERKFKTAMRKVDFHFFPLYIQNYTKFLFQIYSLTNDLN